MKFDIYVENEVNGLECDWDEEITISDEILKEINIDRKDLEENWRKGSVKKPWNGPLVNETVIYPIGALVLFDDHEVFYIQRP